MTRLFLLTAALLLSAQNVQAQQTINCSEDKIDLITATQVEAGLRVLVLGGYLADLRAGGDSARFDYWYGSHTEEQLDYVETLGSNVYNVIDDATFNCDCGEDDPYRYGFVRPGDPPYHLRLCTPFFEAQDFVGENVTTYVHELSHFFSTIDCKEPTVWLACEPDADVPGTPEEAHAFAQDNPGVATINAYNWENFVIDSGRQ